MNAKSDWLKTLIYFGEKRYYKNGLTVPFLCGANTILCEDKTPLSIEDLILEICDISFSYDISILKCGGLGEFVFGTLDSYSKKLYQDNLSKGREIYLKIDNIYVTDGSINNISNKSELSGFLEEKYNEKISNNLFSKNEGKWSDYVPKDLNRLNEIE